MNKYIYYNKIGDNMKSIEIYIYNLSNKINIYIDTINKKIIINNQQKDISEEKIDDLIRIIRTWESNYQNLNNIDSESFEIRINLTNEIEIIKGNGNYPENYMLLKEWIGEFNVQ